MTLPWRRVREDDLDDEVIRAIDRVLADEAKRRGIRTTVEGKEMKALHPRDLTPEQREALIDRIAQILKGEAE